MGYSTNVLCLCQKWQSSNSDIRMMHMLMHNKLLWIPLCCVYGVCVCGPGDSVICCHSQRLCGRPFAPIICLLLPRPKRMCCTAAHRHAHDLHCLRVHHQSLRIHRDKNTHPPNPGVGVTHWTNKEKTKRGGQLKIDF